MPSLSGRLERVLTEGCIELNLPSSIERSRPGNFEENPLFAGSDGGEAELWHRRGATTDCKMNNVIRSLDHAKKFERVAKWLAKQRNRRAHAVKLSPLSGLSLPLTT
ncbi:hypothetical protein [Brucella intermedia]|uniref:hypothetical protein n=1 Tax=Brucella intermedia TaxID=94625 RepID=UPI00124D7BD5|nr:hypothetical protein [Brucella intermedia]KAB2721501.1 hypothetical protein F9L02_23065 [Brucella intermedia]